MSFIAIRSAWFALDRSIGPKAQAASRHPPEAAVVGLDPRSKVVISDCTIFGIDNPDHYPPDLETLVEGVNVIPRSAAALMAAAVTSV